MRTRLELAVTRWASVLGTLLFFTCSAHATSIVGRVVDASTGDPVHGVNVQLRGTPLGATTTDDGSYGLVHPP